MIAASLLAMAGVIGAGLWMLWPTPPRGPADPENLRQVALGEVVYEAHCAACHGANLEGQPDWRRRKANGRLPAPPHDETGHTWHHPDKDLFRVTKRGVRPPFVLEGYESDMAGFAGVLTDEEIWAVIAYIKSRWPPHIRDRQRRIDRASP